MNAHQQVVELLVQRNFHQRLIDNSWRGPYIEQVIELALADACPAWHLMPGNWDPWDLYQEVTSARIQVKQSAILQPWSDSAPPKQLPSPAFSIKPIKTYFRDECWVDLDPPRRLADLYIFALHDETDPDIADHRDLNQWRFFAVPECDLPDQKMISRNPLSELAEPCTYDQLATRVAGAFEGLALKADLPT